jgi:hypothetical protein
LAVKQEHLHLLNRPVNEAQQTTEPSSVGKQTALSENAGLAIISDV